MSEVSVEQWFGMAGAIVIIVTAIVAVPVWINNKLTKTRDHFFSQLAKTTATHSETSGRVGILEVQQVAGSKRLDEIGREVSSVKESLAEMKLKNQENHLTIIGAITSIKVSRETGD